MTFNIDYDGSNFLQLAAHGMGHSYGADNCTGCSNTTMNDVITSDSETSPQCCDDQLLFNANGVYGTEECGSGDSCTYYWCLTNNNCPGSMQCQSDSNNGCCVSTGGDCGGGGGGCIPDGEECTDDPYDCCSEACNGGICSDVDRVIIDLSGRGYQLTSATDGVQFDFYGTGVPTQMSWTAAGWDGGFLALDRNGNGRIDDGAELFSNLSPQPTPKSGNKNGFLALAVYDLPVNGGNGDGWIDDQDAIYSKLLIWVDRNHNGISDPGELLTLKQAGILRISLTYAPSPWTDAFGNKFRYRAQMITTAAANQVVYDVLLQEAAHVPGSTVSTKVL
jgi:hypothetical protein